MEKQIIIQLENLICPFAQMIERFEEEKYFFLRELYSRCTSFL